MPKLTRTIRAARREKTSISISCGIRRRFENHITGRRKRADSFDDGHAHVALLERARVVQTVADHDDGPAGFLEATDEAKFVERTLIEVQSRIGRRTARGNVRVRVRCRR